MAFVIKAGMVLVLTLPVILIPFSLDPDDDGLLPYGFEEQKITADKEFIPAKPVSAGSFVLLVLILISFLNTLVMYMNSHFPNFGESVGLSAEIASLMLSAAMLGNVILKALFGILSDRVGPVKSTLTMIVAVFISLSLMIVFQQAWILLLASFLFGGAFAISGVALTILSHHFYGPFKGAEVYSRVSFFSSFGGAVGVSVAGFIFDYSSSYVPAFIAALAFTVINAVLLVFAQRNYSAKQELN